jgi:hypothetical protein
MNESEFHDRVLSELSDIKERIAHMEATIAAAQANNDRFHAQTLPALYKRIDGYERRIDGVERQQEGMRARIGIILGGGAGAGGLLGALIHRLLGG